MREFGNSDPGVVYDEHVAAQMRGPELAEADESSKDTFKLRPYQLEMLEESMRRNIIVAVRNSRLREVLQAK